MAIVGFFNGNAEYALGFYLQSAAVPPPPRLAKVATEAANERAQEQGKEEHTGEEHTKSQRDSRCVCVCVCVTWTTTQSV